MTGKMTWNARLFVFLIAPAVGWIHLCGLVLCKGKMRFKCKPMTQEEFDRAKT